MKILERDEKRKAEAKLRQEKCDKLTVKQRLKNLDSMFGKGLGAKKERAKLAG